MHTLFSADFFKANRGRLLQRIDPAIPTVITASGLLQRNADTTFPFQQDSNFWYLTGLNEPDLILVMSGGSEYLLVPGRSGNREAFDGAIDFAELARLSGIHDIIAEEDGWQRLATTLKKTGTVQTLAAAPSYIEQYGMYTNPARARLVERLMTWQPDVKVVDIREHLIYCRSRKQPEELKALQRAIDITADGLRRVTEPARLAAYEYEFEIENDLSSAFRTHEASGHAFAPIIAAGKHGVTLHNVANDGELHGGELVMLDVGAEVSHYAADITRTVAIGTPTKRQVEVFAAVQDVQRYALTLLKPGTLLKEYEAAVEEYMGGKLQQLGLITKADHDDIRHYYPHATSHFLGLDVHDVGNYDQPLEAGMVLTCEPGIYIPEEGIGVRIEDDVLITDAAHTVLSAGLAAELNA